MMKLKTCALMICILMLSGIGGSAYGQCVADGNDTEADATPIGYIQTVSDWVCPDDLFDYYTLEIDPGASVSGTITFESPQPSTVLRVWHSESGVRLVDDIFTNDTVHQHAVQVSMNSALGGAYYARVFYWSEATCDHEYTLTLDLEVTGEPELEFGYLEASLLETKNAPWPSLRADKRNTNRSTFSGPGSTAVLTATHLLCSDLDLDWDRDHHVFENLLLGPDNRAYFENKGTHTLYAWDLIDGYQWEFPLVNTEKTSFCLDAVGNIYAIAWNGTYLHKLAPNGIEIWNKRISGADGQNMALWPVGHRICMSETIGGKVYFYIWEQNGTEVVARTELCDLHLPGVVQSNQLDIYVRKHSSIYKYDLNGIVLWADHYVGPSSEGLIAIGEDRRVWVYLETGCRYKVYNPDGTIFRDANYPNPGAPVDACIGGDGRFYVITNNGQLICYENWDQEVWRIDNPGIGNIMQIIMDKNGFIYILYSQLLNHYTCFWAMVDNEDGEILFQKNIPSLGIDNINHTRGQIAIGENGYLVNLNRLGFLWVYKPAPTFGAFEVVIEN